MGIGAGPGRLDRGHVEGVDTLPQAGRQHLPHSRQRARGCLFDTGTRPGRDPQRHRERDRLLVVEQERGQLATRLEPITTLGSLDRPDGVTEFAQPIDIAANRAFAHRQPLGEQRSRPVTADLQQRQQREQAARRHL